MSSPPSSMPPADGQAAADPNLNQKDQIDADVDAEMTGTGPQDSAGAADTATATTGVQSTTTNAAQNEAGTIDHTTQSTTTTQSDNAQQQPATSTSAPGLLQQQQNRKDVTLREFLSKMDDYAPIIPDAVTAHYLTLSGLPPPSQSDPTGASTNTTPLPLARLLALATQKFIADIAADAYQYSRIRSSNSAAANNPLGNAGLGVGGGPAAPGAGGVGALGKGQQATQLGVQRSGYGGGGQGGSSQGKTVLTMEDLGMAVQEYGVNVKRSEFYR
ncbi:hypothetical protein HRR83_001470 [Exophiala dermatitidis]|uniref:Transcription initiation factor TFIID subunit 10 n=2 Tax=Exophiala dermatitidis TaxID=5970 RepID=H6C6B3_EXODN|nr:transcription initiation factor TFIID subunit D8 [Exophiala dermatitidis NIH/UT8656]KAJ4522961.1 hypothetical protein HRR75_001357 [Exophiala dermatitidis]EHY59259.1 transcription initiation factor TFIID subunit D8 [Exophiala dermatitidis NIH/UT8656]KAJ4526279.1 hypothetical protein HRR74_001474 [Exophiala dermatitidis]KAJ4526778.1 hypothetical protein HRR73_001573 [Exophiala dermatitidis]KAJ4532486.1 hypothetical protein HRR76_007476 [Exophiala dermatitidis]